MPLASISAASVDRIGADLFAIDHAARDAEGVVEGEQDRIHKSSGDGHDQARNQRHSKLVWDRNAHDVADALVALAHERRATHALLTGDLRRVDLVRSGEPEGIADAIVAAWATGASIVATQAPHLRDGIAALLRRSNHPVDS